MIFIFWFSINIEWAKLIINFKTNEIILIQNAQSLHLFVNSILLKKNE